jgi:hypothetical protein
LCGWASDSQLLTIVEEGFGAGGEEEGGDDLGDSEIVSTVGVTGDAAFVGRAVGGEKWKTVASLEDVLKRVDGRANGGGAKCGAGSWASVQDELRALRIWRSVGSLTKIGRERGVDIGDYDTLAKVAGGGFAKSSGLAMREVGRADDVKAGDAVIEPEADDGERIGVGALRVEIEQDADVATAGFVDEVVEIVECAVGRIDGLSVGEVELNGGEEDCVDAERVEIVETLSYAVEATAIGRTEVGWVHVVDDSVLPPEIGSHSRADPAGTSECLCRCGRAEDAGEKQG